MTSKFLAERIRQERETFDQNKAQEERWFVLRLRMGYTAIFLLSVIAIISGVVTLDPADYSNTTVVTATRTLLVDVLGVLIAVWKIVLNRDSAIKLKPLTRHTGDAGEGS